MSHISPGPSRGSLLSESEQLSEKDISATTLFLRSCPQKGDFSLTAAHVEADGTIETRSYLHINSERTFLCNFRTLHTEKKGDTCFQAR